MGEIKTKDPESKKELSSLLKELPESTKRIERLLDECDWKGVEKVLKARDGLLGDLSRTLRECEQNSNEHISAAERRRIRWTLEDMQTANSRLLKALGGRLSYLRERIQGINKGRKTLDLYRLPGKNQPRFCDRIG